MAKKQQLAAEVDETTAAAGTPGGIPADEPDPSAKPAPSEPPTAEPGAGLPAVGAKGTFRHWGPESRDDAVKARIRRLGMIQSGKAGPNPDPSHLSARATQTEDGLRAGYPELSEAKVLAAGARPNTVKVELVIGTDADGGPVTRVQDNVVVGEASQKGVFAPK